MPIPPRAQSRLTRFFVAPEQVDAAAGVVILDAEDASHLDRVLRARPGDEIAALDNTGALYRATLTTLAKSRAEAAITSTEYPGTEPAIAVTIAQALPKTAEKLEWVLQHGTEIGAAAFAVFRARRSEAGKLAERPDRWTKIVKTAAEQSGRARLPAVRLYSGLSSALEDQSSSALKLLCDEAEQARFLRDALRVAAHPLRSAVVLVGPEGGWSEEERAECLALGALPVSLGKRILRTETAALMAVSQILFAADN